MISEVLYDVASSKIVTSFLSKYCWIVLKYKFIVHLDLDFRLNMALGHVCF